MLKKTYFVLGAAFLSSAMWMWLQSIYIAHQQAESAEHSIPRGNLSDLYPRWLGARELLLHGRDPYSKDVTREIQAGYYGRPLDASRPSDPKDQQAFAYPLYVVFLLAPTVKLPFPLVQRAFLWLLVILTAASVPLWLRALRWQLSLAWQSVWIIVTFGCFPVIQGLKLQQLTLLVAALLAAAMYAVTRRLLVMAGILLALASIKPQLVFLFSMWLLIWVAGKWRERQRLFWSFALSAAILVIAGELRLPGWVHQFRLASADYYRYTGGGRSLLDVLLTPASGRVLSVILVGVTLIFQWKLRTADQGTPQFVWSLALTAATTLAVIPMFSPYNQILLLPALMLLVRMRHHLWNNGRLSRFCLIVAAAAVFWPWVAALALDLSFAIRPEFVLKQAWALPVYTTLTIPIAVLALVLVSRKLLHTAGTQLSGLRSEAL